MFQPDAAEPAKPWAPDWISVKFARRARKLGFDIGLHSLRHTHASQLLSNNIPIAAVQGRLGHSSPRVTLDFYTHKLKEAEARASDEAARIIKDALAD